MTEMENESSGNQAVFHDLDPEDKDQGVTEIESLCMNCHEQGMTRLMLTRIPHFKEVIISSFTCDHCGFENREVAPGGRIQDRGIRYTVTIRKTEDLNRQVVKSDWATFALPDLEFEQPPNARKAEISTVEGLIDAVKTNLEKEQPLRVALEPETADKVEGFIQKLSKLKTLESSFTMVVDDPSGNSFVENPLAPLKDPAMIIQHYTRSREQDEKLGVVVAKSCQPGQTESEATEPRNSDLASKQGTKPDTNQKQGSSEEGNSASSKPLEVAENLKQEVLMFRSNCPECNTPCDTNMKLVDIPFFKQVVVMATTCDACGFRDNEVKSGSGIEPKGTRITLKLTDPTDLNRDVLKSDTCGLKIPEIDLEMEEGSLGGRFTTLEGLLTNIKDQLIQKNPFVSGDSAQDSTRAKLDEFCKKLDKIINGEMLNIHIILDDPAGNSFLQNVYAPETDPEMTVERYERNRDQMDILGLLHMETEGYQNS